MMMQEFSRYALNYTTTKISYWIFRSRQ